MSKNTDPTENNGAPDVPVTALVPLATSSLTIDDAVENLRKTSNSISEELKGKVLNILGKAKPNKKGMEEVDTTWRLPMVRIKQPVSTSEDCPEDAKPGDLFIAGSKLPKELTITPVKFYLRNDMFEPGQRTLACSSPDARLGSPLGWCKDPVTGEECPHLPLGMNSRGERTNCTNSLVAIVVDKELNDIYEVRFSKTSRKAGSALQRLSGVGSVVWEKWFKLTAEKQTGGQGVYYTFKITPTGEKVDTDVMKVCDSISDLATASRVTFLKTYYGRRQNAAEQAKSIEASDSKTMLGNNSSGEEPEFVEVKKISPKTYKNSM